MLLVCASAAPASAQNAAAPGGVVEVDPASRLIVVTPPSTFPGEMIVGYNASPVPFIYFVELNGSLDRANTVDGERDVVNGGKGHDVVTADGKDKVKNAEVVRRK